MKPRQPTWVWVMMALLLSMALFALRPELDNQVSRHYFDPALPGFPAKGNTWLTLLYQLAPLLNQILFVASVLVVVAVWRKPHWVSVRWRRRSMSWALMMVLGIGVVVDWALKDHVGRARPEQTHTFGGPLADKPLFEWRQSCDLNCSFVSGHAAGGFALMAWGMWAPRRKRHQWMVLGLLAGSGLGWMRIAQGGHYLSDVVFAGWVIWLVYHAIRHIWLHSLLRRIRSLHS